MPSIFLGDGHGLPCALEDETAKLVLWLTLADCPTLRDEGGLSVGRPIKDGKRGRLTSQSYRLWVNASGSTCVVTG